MGMSLIDIPASTHQDAIGIARLTARRATMQTGGYCSTSPAWDVARPERRLLPGLYASTGWGVALAAVSTREVHSA